MLPPNKKKCEYAEKFKCKAARSAYGIRININLITNFV